MRTINKIIIHCSATQEGRDLDAAEINRWHLKRGWKGIGYHYVVLLDGTIEYGRSIYEHGAHVKNHNERFYRNLLYWRRRVRDEAQTVSGLLKTLERLSKKKAYYYLLKH